MLGLCEQVERDDPGVDLLVEDDKEVARACESVDADHVGELALCLLHIQIARSHDDVHALDRRGS